MQWNDRETGNPVVPGYLADPTVFYDEASQAFYVFATSDGVTSSFSREPHMAITKDFYHWQFEPVRVPDCWRLPSVDKPLADGGIWAPSIMKHPTNGKVYLLYTIESCTYVALADSPLGPWRNATAGQTADTAPLVRKGELWGGGDAFDGEFFADDDGTVYLTIGGWYNRGMLKLKVDREGLVSVDNDDARFPDGKEKKFLRIRDLPEAGEGSLMLKHEGVYYKMWSGSGWQNYCVRYATAPSPVGPFTASPDPVVVRDDAVGLLGPGHHTMLKFRGAWYILYHRQSYPYADAKRQLAIDRVHIADGRMSAGVQSHDGLARGCGPLEDRYQAAVRNARVNLALGRPALASSAGDYKGGVEAKETFASVPAFYEATYAFDENYGTRWAPQTAQSEPAWLMVDLGRDQEIAETQIVFEYVFRKHAYRIDVLSADRAATLEAAAQVSDGWTCFAQRQDAAPSPVMDRGRAQARFVRLTVLSADLPRGEEALAPGKQDYTDRISVVEFRVFGNP